MKGPMEGVRVLDLGSMIAGPVATTVLADQGADVIKVETVGIGDLMRHLGATRNGVSSLFHNCNRGKRSIALDLKSEAGAEVVRRLAARVDVVVENFRPGVTERLGVDYAALSAVNPDLIYLSVCGFGHEGPLANKPAYDNVIQTFGGIAQSQADRSTGEPMLYQQLFSDKVTALTGSQAVSAALFARERGAGGQHVKLSMVGTVVNFMWADLAGTDAFLEEGASEGLKVSSGVRLMAFKDGHGSAAPVSDRQFHSYCKVFGVDAIDPELATVAGRNSHLDLMADLLRRIADRAAQMRVKDAMAALEAEDVPCAEALHLSELPDHPQLRAIDAFAEVRHPQGGLMREPANPPDFCATASPPLRPAPALGEHTDAILAEVGMDAGEIDGLRAAGVVA